MMKSVLLLAATIFVGIALSVDAYCQKRTEADELSKNKAVVRRYFEEIVKKQRPELLSEIYAEDYFFHSLENGREGRGLKGLEDFLPYFFKAFPDIHYTIDQMVAEGDKVVVQVTARGTQREEFWGYPLQS